MDIANIINKKCNLLTIIAAGSRKNYILAKCDCGVVKEYYVYNLFGGHAKSCGCLRFKGTTFTHGKSKHPLFDLWNDIKKRCFNNNCKAYPNYGGRGITICNEWVIDFMIFYDWAMANGWEKGLEIDRINNDGNYEPNNCRFVSREVNVNNRRTTRLISINNETKSLAQWAHQYKISPLALHSRLKNNWDIMDALTMPIQMKGGNNSYADRLKRKQLQET